MFAAYPAMKEIIDCDKYTDEDVADYVTYCNRGAVLKDIKSWEEFRAIKKKVKTEGPGSVLFHSKVKAETTTINVESARGYGVDEVKAVKIFVENMGYFFVTKDRRIVDNSIIVIYA